MQRDLIGFLLKNLVLGISPHARTDLHCFLIRQRKTRNRLLVQRYGNCGRRNIFDDITILAVARRPISTASLQIYCGVGNRNNACLDYCSLICNVT